MAELAAPGPVGQQAHSEAADTNASNVPSVSVGQQQTSEGQGSAIQPRSLQEEESAFSAAEEGERVPCSTGTCMR